MTIKEKIIVTASALAFFFCVQVAWATDYAAESEEVVIPISDFGESVVPPPLAPPALPPAPPVHAPKETPLPTPSAPPEAPSLPTGGSVEGEINAPGAPTPPSVAAGDEQPAPQTTPFEGTAARITAALAEFVEVARKRVFEDPQVKTAVNIVVIPATTAVTVTAAATLNMAFILQYLIFLFSQPFAFLDRRRAKRWGTVYNAFTKMPIDLATVRLLDATGRVVRTRVTDAMGRYLFIAPPGSYALEAAKTGFVFPSPSVAETRSDAQYADVYNGGKIEVAKEAVSVNVPIEPSGEKETAKTLIRRRAGIAFKHGLAVASTAVAFFSLAISFTVWTAAACLIQLLLLLVVERYVWKKHPAETGKVTGRDGRPVRAVVRLFETAYDKLVDSAVTDGSGRFAFLVGANKYYAVAEAPGFAPVKTQIFDFSSSKGEQAIAPIIKLG